MSDKTKTSATTDRTDDVLLEFARLHEKMNCWTALAREARDVPYDIAVAIMSCRPELVLTPKGPVSEAHVAGVYDVLRILLETIAVHQRHAALLAELAGQSLAGLKQSVGKVQDLIDVCHYRDPLIRREGDGDDE